jgi:hypothetical protein
MSAKTRPENDLTVVSLPDDVRRENEFTNQIHPTVGRDNTPEHLEIPPVSSELPQKVFKHFMLLVVVERQSFRSIVKLSAKVGGSFMAIKLPKKRTEGFFLAGYLHQGSFLS